MPMEYFCMDDHFPGIFDSYIVEEDSHSTDLSVSGEEGDSTILLAHYSTGNKSQKIFFKTYQSKSTAVWLRKKNPAASFFCLQ